MRITFLITLLCLLAGCKNVTDENSLKKSSAVQEVMVKIEHPSFPDGQLQEEELLIFRDKDGHVVSYQIEVDSVICLDTTCEIIPVRLYWDILGQYDHYELPGNGKLTKKDHILFTEEDYQKLDRILGDRRSFLKDLKSEQIVNPEKAVKTADGVSAPTPVSMQSAVVAGAAYTCYTLWHWVNGQVADIILERTTSQIDTNQLMDLYLSGDRAYIAFAIDQLIARKIYDPVTVDAVAVKMATHEDYVKPVLHYLTQASLNLSSHAYHESIEKVFLQSDKGSRIRMLESLIASTLDSPAGFYDRISRFLPELESYYEVHLLLELQARHNLESAAVNKQAVALLDNDNFLIARKAFWFLQERSLEENQIALMNTFEEQYRDRL